MGCCGLTPIETAIEAMRFEAGLVVIRSPSPMFTWMLEFFELAIELRCWSRARPHTEAIRQTATPP